MVSFFKSVFGKQSRDHALDLGYDTFQDEETEVRGHYSQIVGQLDIFVIIMEIVIAFVNAVISTRMQSSVSHE